MTKRSLRLHRVALAMPFAIALLAACATAESAFGTKPDAVEDLIAPDSGADGALADVDECNDDCAYFPPECSADALCPNGPFAPNTAGGPIDARTRINVIRGRSVNDVWAVGALGAVAHFDGTSWRRSDLGRQHTLHALWLRDTAEIALATFDIMYTRGLDVPDGGAEAPSTSSDGWTAHGRPPAPADFVSSDMQLVSAWAAPDPEWLWCAASARQAGEAGGLWRLRVSPSTGTLEIGSVVPPDQCWDPFIREWVACGTMCKYISCSQITSIHGASSDDLWAVGLQGSVVRITHASSDVPTVTPYYIDTWSSLFGVWASSDTDVWAVGANGVVRHYDGDGVLWKAVEVPTSSTLNAVWGSSASDVWAVGDDAVVLHYDGASWSRVKIAGLSGRRPKLTSVWVPASGHVWVGGEGVILSLGANP